MSASKVSYKCKNIAVEYSIFHGKKFREIDFILFHEFLLALLKFEKFFPIFWLTVGRTEHNILGFFFMIFGSISRNIFLFFMILCNLTKKLDSGNGN